jgi:dihydroflavonol-4-reductase
MEGLHAEIFKGDFADFETAIEAVKGCNIIIHAAADTSQRYSVKNYNVQCNITGTRNLLKASLLNCSERFIFISTANTFGHGTKECPGDESKPPRFPFTQSGYAISKTMAQDLVTGYSMEKGLPAIIVNPTFMIGPWDSKPSSGRIITMMHKSKVIPVPPGGKNFIHVADAAIAVCNAIKMGRSGHYYLLANENLTFGEFYAKMRYVAGKNYRIVNLNRNFMSAAGLFGNLKSFAGLRTDLNLVNARILCEGNYYTGSKAIKELGLPQTPVEQAIADAYEWFGRNGYL